MTAREVALGVVRDVFCAAGPGRGSQEALDYRLRRSGLDPRDAAFATTLAYGAIKMRRTLDWYLRPYLDDRRKSLPPAIAETLRLGIYELRFAQAQPYAAVSQWVGLAKRVGHRGTAGLVNAILRAFVRDDPAPPQRADFESDEEFWGTRYSFPTWLVRQWSATLGSERIEAILRACNDPAQASVVVNRRKLDRSDAERWFAEQGLRSRPSPFAEDALLLESSSGPRGLQERAMGAWWMQSESSAMVVDVLGPQPGERVADACSGRGNKALQSAARVGAGGELLCIERDARKVAALDRRADEAGLRVATIVGDATQVALEGNFDRILVDAPCSGTGVVGRHAEARWRKHPEDGERLAVLQHALLEALSARLYEGGTIVYAACSIDPRETTEVVELFMRSHNLERGPVPQRYAPFETPEGDVLVPPGLEGRDGFFIARLERR